jgi:hypothetical protein
MDRRIAMAPPTAPTTLDPVPALPQSCSRASRNGWITLDRSWAERLGAQRQSGAYRIRRRELVDRLATVGVGRPDLAA